MQTAEIKERRVTPVESSNPRINNFNIIRFTAAIMVLYGHMAAVMLSWYIIEKPAQNPGKKILAKLTKR